MNATGTGPAHQVQTEMLYWLSKERCGGDMRKVILGMVMGFGMALAGLSAASAAPVAGGDMASAVTASAAALQQVQFGGYCARLKRACEYKEERGESGQGNCRRYREECGGRRSNCERLRRACEYKDERGEWGQGNCRRYRQECGRSSY
jgi:hypothetical protein